jgi:O-antigen/teichoic acid export membrane protein
MAIRLFGFATQIFIAWILTPEDIGRIKVMQSFIAISVVFSAFGMNNSTLKLCSENRPEGEILFLFKKGIVFTILPVLVTLCVLLALAHFKYLSVDKEINGLMLILSFGLIPFTFNNISASFLQALKKMKSYSQIQIVSKSIGIGVVVLLSFFFQLRGYVFALIFGYTLTLVLLFLFLRKNFNIRPIPVKNPFRIHLNYSFYSFLSNITGVFTNNMDILILNYLTINRTELGYYSYAITFVGLLRLISVTVQQISNPYFSSKGSNFNSWLQTYHKYNRLMFYFSIIIFMGSMLIIPFFMKYALNGKYEDSIVFFILLGIAWIPKSNITIQGSALFGLGKININFMLSLFALISSIVLIYLGAYFYDIKGAAYGALANGILSYIVSKVVFQKLILKEALKYNQNENKPPSK